MAKEFYIYPTKGQSAEQQEKDKFECYDWAKRQSGFDPMQPVQATRPPPAEKAPTASAGKGLLGGAVGGAIIGGIAGDVGKGAAIGAVGGGLFGGMRRRDQTAKQDQSRKQWEQEQAANYAQQRNNYNRAYVACLEARNYTVK